MDAQNLNAHIAKLIEMLEEQAAQNTAGNFNFVPALISSAKAFQGEVLLSDDELSYSIDTQERQRLGEELATFYQVLSRGYSYKYPEDKETIQKLKRVQTETYAQFYERLVDEITALSAEFKTWFEADSGLNIASFESNFDPWIALVEKEAGRKEVVQKIQQAIDLRSLLIGALRMYSLSDFDIRSTLANLG